MLCTLLIIGAAACFPAPEVPPSPVATPIVAEMYEPPDSRAIARESEPPAPVSAPAEPEPTAAPAAPPGAPGTFDAPSLFRSTLDRVGLADVPITWTGSYTEPAFTDLGPLAADVQPTIGAPGEVLSPAELTGSFPQRRILVSLPFLQVNSADTVEQMALHEAAHLIHWQNGVPSGCVVPAATGTQVAPPPCHDAEWAAIAGSIGYRFGASQPMILP